MMRPAYSRSDYSIMRIVKLSRWFNSIAIACGCVAFCNGCTQIRQSQATFVAKDGVRAYAKGDAAASLSHFDRALALDPHDAWALGNRAGLLMLRGQFDRALSDLDEALRLDPKQHHALINRCIALTHKAKLGQALDDCNAAVELSPANGYYRIMRASLLTEMSRNEEAERDIAEAMRIDPANASVYSTLCHIRRKTKHYADALAACERAVAIAPNVQSAQMRALSALDLGQVQLALTYLDDAIARYPNEIALRAIRAKARKTSGDIQGSIADYKHVAESQPTDPLARYDRGSAMIEIGRFAEARSELENAYRSADEFLRPSIARELAWLLASAPNDELRDGKEALRLIQEIVTATAPANAHDLTLLAAAQAELGQYELAIEAQSRAIALLNPNRAREISNAQKDLENYRSGKPSRLEPLSLP